MAGGLEKERAGRGKGQESQQEKERKKHQDLIGPPRQQTQMLLTLVDL